jgi:hypothetical protein
VPPITQTIPPTPTVTAAPPGAIAEPEARAIVTKIGEALTPDANTPDAREAILDEYARLFGPGKTRDSAESALIGPYVQSRRLRDQMRNDNFAYLGAAPGEPFVAAGGPNRFNVDIRSRGTAAASTSHYRLTLGRAADGTVIILKDERTDL